MTLLTLLHLNLSSATGVVSAAQAAPASSAAVGQRVVQANAAVQAAPASAAIVGQHVSQADVAALASNALSSVEVAVSPFIATIVALASPASCSIIGTVIRPPIFAIGGDPALYPVLVSVLNPFGQDLGGIAPATASYIFGLADTTDVVVVADVVIPPVLETLSETDPHRFGVYWLMRNYFALPQVRDQIEPIRAKVASTQDLSLLTDTDRRVVQTLNNLYNSDIENFTYSQTVAAQ